MIGNSNRQGITYKYWTVFYDARERDKKKKLWYGDIWIVLCTVVSGEFRHDLLLWFVPNKKKSCRYDTTHLLEFQHIKHVDGKESL